MGRSLARWLAALVLAGSLAASGPGGPPAVAASAAPQGSSPAAALRLGNSYVEVVLNASPDAGGRFTINATGGNPDRADDDGKPLLYGGDEPWTSFTTVRIGGRDFIFGGVTHRPAGRGGPFGEPLVPPRQDPDSGTLEAAWRFPPGVEVTQRLALTRGLTTGLVDTVRIEYVIVNRTDRAQRVGLRLVLDVMAGSNDGAPFRVGGQAIEVDTGYAEPSALPDFWQVFDSLTEPAVVAQGTLRGEGLTAPDRVYFTNWGALRDSAWEFDFRPGRSFERLGEVELDSAVALFFDPVEIPPGQRRVVATAYGLGGISIAPGQLAVGLSGPEMAVVGDPQPLTVVAYVQNTGQGAARDLRLTLQLPEGLALLPGETAQRRLGQLPAGQIAQAAWRVRAVGQQPGGVTYSVRAEAENAEPNQASRSLRLVSPARLRVDLRGPSSLAVVDGRWVPFPFQVEAELVNEGGAAASGLWVQLNSPLLAVSPGDALERYVGVLQPGERYVMRWLVRPRAVGNLPWSVRVHRPGSEPMPVPTSTVSVPPLSPTLTLRLLGVEAPVQLAAGDPLNVAVDLLNAPAGARVEAAIRWDPGVLRLAGGPLGVDLPAGAEGLAQVTWDPDQGGLRIQLVLGPAPPGQPVRLAVIRLVAAGEGSTRVRLARASLADPSGQPLPLAVSEGAGAAGRELSVTVQAAQPEPGIPPVHRGGLGS